MNTPPGRRREPGRTRRTGSVFAHMLRLSLAVDRRAVALIAVITAAYAASIYAVATSQRWAVDASRSHTTVAIVAAAALGTAGHLVRSVCHRIQTHLEGDLSDRVAVQVADDILQSVAAIPTITHLEDPEYLDRITVLQQGSRHLAKSCWTVGNAAASALSLALSVALLASIEPWLMVLAVLAVAPMWSGERGQQGVRGALRKSGALLRHEQQLHALCVTPASAKELWIAGSGAAMSDLAYLRWEEYRRLERRARMKGALWQAAGWVVYSAGLAGTLAAVAHLALRREASLGDVVLVVSLSMRLRTQVSETVGGVGEIVEARHVAEEYLWLQEHATSLGHGEAAVPGTAGTGLRLRNVGFRYRGAARQALSGVSFSAPAGSVVGVVGLNGAGKSTLIKLLLGLYQPTEGQILLDGQSVALMDPARWFAANSAAFQDFSTFRLTLGEVVGLGDLPRRDDSAAVRSALETAGAGGVVATAARGLETSLENGAHGADLSHGQWQKLALARSFMRRDPLLLVLDEPASALDPQAEHDLFVRVAQHARELGRRAGTVTVLISHRFSTLHMADQLVVMSDGEVTERGTHGELMSAQGQYADLYRLQAAAYT